MKAIIFSCIMFLATSVFATGEGAMGQEDASVVKGEVLEVINVENFTYLRLDTHAGEIWTAVISAPIKKGNVVAIKDAIVMTNFESKILKRTFPTILFGNLVGAPKADGQATNNTAPIGMGSSFIALSQRWKTSSTRVPKASNANALTIAEIVSGANKLEGKSVVVRGKVVKYNPDIMGKNWIHLRDGSGAEVDQTNDILVTSANSVKPGDVVTFKGIVRTAQDFGAGYSYKVLIEEAVAQ
jgi:hypothetical protein